MRSVLYDITGDPEVLQLVDRPEPQVGAGEVRVRVIVSGVNPTDWKSRRGIAGPGVRLERPQVPNQDGAGVVDAIGDGVTDLSVGDRVWVWDAAYQRPEGTAQELVVLPRRHAIALPAEAGFDLGASLGIPALTAHRALTAHDRAPQRLTPGSLAGLVVLVTGGAGAVGHAAIQLARWAGAEVLATVSGPEKADLARAAGAQTIIDYRTQDVAEAVRAAHPAGADIIVDVDLAHNIAASLEAAAIGGTISAYAAADLTDVVIPIRAAMTKNVRVQFLLTYTYSETDKDAAVAAVADAVADGAMSVGEAAGLPLHRFPLDETAAAHRAVEQGAVGKVLIDVQSAGE
jgi:NADPH2:quinone reductase